MEPNLAAEADADAEREHASLGWTPGEGDVEPDVRRPIGPSGPDFPRATRLGEWFGAFSRRGHLFIRFEDYGTGYQPHDPDLDGAFCPIGADPVECCAAIPGACCRVRRR